MKVENCEAVDNGPTEEADPRYVIEFCPVGRGIVLQNGEGDVLILARTGTDKERRVMSALVGAAAMLLDREAERELEKIKASLGSFAGMLQAIGSVVGGSTKAGSINLDTAVREEVARETGLPKSCPECGALMRAGEEKCLVCDMLAEKETDDAQGSAQTESTDR